MRRASWVLAFVLLSSAFARAAELTTPKTVDPRLKIELFAADPDIVTPCGLAIDARGRVFVVESHTHFPPANYAGQKADRIRLFEDTNSDGRPDLVAPGLGGKVAAWRNITERTTAEATRIRFEAWPNNAESWRSAQGVDLDLDGRLDLLGLAAAKISWARNETKRFTGTALPIKLEDPRAAGSLAVDLVGDPLPDVLVVGPGRRHRRSHQSPDRGHRQRARGPQVAVLRLLLHRRGV